MSAEIRWTPAEVLSIQSTALRDMEAESAQAGELERAHEFERLAGRAEAALAVEREAGR